MPARGCLKSQVSAQHAVAVSLATGKAGLAQFSDAAVADPALRALYPRLTFVDDPAYAVEAAQVRLRLDCGRVLSQHVAIARGSLGAPLSDADLESKLHELAAYGGSSCAVQPLLDRLWALEAEEDAGRLMELAAG